MTRYTVALLKPVSDITRAFVTVEANTPEEAEAKALELDTSELEFEFWQCADNDDPIEAECMGEAEEATP